MILSRYQPNKITNGHQQTEGDDERAQYFDRKMQPFHCGAYHRLGTLNDRLSGFTYVGFFPAKQSSLVPGKEGGC